MLEKIIIEKKIDVNNYFKKRMLKRISKIEDDGEFESIYNKIINVNEIDEAKREHRKNFINLLVSIVLRYLPFILLFLGCILAIKLDVNMSWMFGVWCIFFMICLFISVVLEIKRNIKYKEKVIKNLISFIDPTIKYGGNKNDCSVFKELYLDAIYREKKSYIRNFTDYMEYELANDVSMKLANCSIYKKKGIYEKVSAGAKIFEGVVVKLSRNCNISNNILIERNKIFKGKERVKDTNQEFEKYFDLYADEMENIDAIVNEGVKKN